MGINKLALETDLYNILELHNHFHDLYTKTNFLGNDILSNGITNISLIELRLSEIFSLFNNAKLFISINGRHHHYEFSSLLSFWEQTYAQMYLVARHQDRSTSRLHGEFDNFIGQYEIVENMLETQIKEFKNMLGMKTAD